MGIPSDFQPGATMNRKRLIGTAAAIGAACVGLGLVLEAGAQQEKAREKEQAKPKLGYTDTPMLPDGKYRVHDGTRPQPSVVTPATPSTQEAPGKAPSDAVVLFDGSDLSKWEGPGGKPAGWKVEDGAMVIAPKAGAIHTKEKFGDFQLHLEWAAPDPPKGRDQGRGNSGIEVFGRFEIQVLDSYENLTYPDGQAGALYGQYPPLVNATRPPGQWQTYDILFNAPHFAPDGSLESPAYATVILNGVVLHNHTPILGEVAFKNLPKYKAHESRGPIQLQDHGNPVRFRNIWIRELKGYDQP
jgi:hypothetical protein